MTRPLPRSSIPVAELTRWTAEDMQPPLCYVEAAWARLWRGEWALRFPSLFAGVLIVPALGAGQAAVRARSGRAIAAPAAALAALATLCVLAGGECSSLC
jgi:hypothetical protein